MWLSAPGLVSLLHRDLADNLNVTIHGLKRFTLFSPDDDDLLYPHGLLSSLPNAARVDPESPDLARYPRTLGADLARCKQAGAALVFAPSAESMYPPGDETRVRVDAYSHVRAIVETSDGKLHMVTRFVKASGGCSAPAGSDAAAAQASLGQMRFRVEGDLKGKEPVLAQLAIEHPNHSGLAMDQATRQYTPAHYVRKIEVSYAGRPVLSADVDFSMSENPNFRFWFQPQGAGELRASVVDSQELRFVAAQALRDNAR